MPDNFKFAIGDRVAVVFQVFDNGRIGTITGYYGRHDNIPRETDTVLATTPWPELMYTVRCDDGDPLDMIREESSLMPLADFQAARSWKSE